MAPVRLRCQAASRIDRIHYRQRNVGDGLLARLSHFARHVGFCERNAATLTSTCGLSITESSRAAISSRTGPAFCRRRGFCRYRGRRSCHRHSPSCPYRWRCGTDLRGGQLRVVPDGNHQHVADADAILVVLKLAIQFRIRAGVDFAGSNCSTSPGVRG